MKTDLNFRKICLLTTIDNFLWEYSYQQGYLIKYYERLLYKTGHPLSEDDARHTDLSSREVFLFILDTLLEGKARGKFRERVWKVVTVTYFLDDNLLKHTPIAVLNIFSKTITEYIKDTKFKLKSITENDKYCIETNLYPNGYSSSNIKVKTYMNGYYYKKHKDLQENRWDSYVKLK